jgi:hypothetical protein
MLEYACNVVDNGAGRYMLILNMHIACLACGTVKTLYKSYNFHTESTLVMNLSQSRAITSGHSQPTVDVLQTGAYRVLQQTHQHMCMLAVNMGY